MRAAAAMEAVAMEAAKAEEKEEVVMEVAEMAQAALVSVAAAAMARVKVAVAVVGRYSAAHDVPKMRLPNAVWLGQKAPLLFALHPDSV